MSAPPPSDQMRASGSGRRKVALPAGRSQLDWVRNSARIIPQRPRSITREELRKHRSKNDVWMAIESQVYDVTPYVEYHPGGVPMIIAGAGKDATKLFNKYHAWVNPAFMLRNCYLGSLDDDGEEDDDDEDDDDDFDEGELADAKPSTTESNGKK